MTLRGVKSFQETDPDKIDSPKKRDAIELDARMAAEVTEIIRRAITEEL